MSILNLTQHNATSEQIAAGVINLPEDVLPIIRNLLTFTELPSSSDIKERAGQIAAIAADCADPEDRGDNNGFALSAMIGGAPFLMSALEHALLDVGIAPVYAFSVRESIETTGSNGDVIKTNVFKHSGFVEVD